MRRAFSYVRFSSPEQAKGDSLRRQVAASEDYCRRHGLVLDDSLRLRDLGVSAFRGTHAKKGALSAFLLAVEAGKVGKGAVLIVESLDRLSREEIGEALHQFIGILYAGVNIVTLSPERQYSRASINDLASLLEPLVIMSRANEESQRKAERLGAAWSAKKRMLSQTKMTAACPSWLVLSEDRKRFEVIPEKAKIIRRIVRDVFGGVGIASIVKSLTREGVPSIGRAAVWHRSYVTKILHNPALYGEFTPHRLTAGRNSQRIPDGDPIPNYFPALISEADYYRIQKVLTSRQTQRGPTGNHVANLFTGLVRDARDKATMAMTQKGSKGRPQLVSSAAQRGAQGSEYVSFPYGAFEAAILLWTGELKGADLVPVEHQETGLEDAQERIAVLDGRIETCKRKMQAAGGDFDALIEVLEKLTQQRRELAAMADAINDDPVTSNLADCKAIGDLLGAASGDELRNLRLRLRAKIRELVSEVWMLVFTDDGQCRVALVQVHFAGGGVRRLKIVVRRGKTISFGDVRTEGGFDLRTGKVTNRAAMLWGHETKADQAMDDLLTGRKPKKAAVKAVMDVARAMRDECQFGGVIWDDDR